MVPANYHSKLVIQLQNTVRELERLRHVHLPLYAGKIGEPDLVVTNRAKQLLKEIESSN
jgi:hypothetical protein